MHAHTWCATLDLQAPIPAPAPAPQDPLFLQPITAPEPQPVLTPDLQPSLVPAPDFTSVTAPEDAPALAPNLPDALRREVIVSLKPAPVQQTPNEDAKETFRAIIVIQGVGMLYATSFLKFAYAYKSLDFWVLTCNGWAQCEMTLSALLLLNVVCSAHVNLAVRPVAQLGLWLST